MQSMDPEERVGVRVVLGDVVLRPDVPEGALASPYARVRQGQGGPLLRGRRTPGRQRAMTGELM